MFVIAGGAEKCIELLKEEEVENRTRTLLDILFFLTVNLPTPHDHDDDDDSEDEEDEESSAGMLF